MNKIVTLLFVFILMACNGVSKKTEQTLNKVGEAAGKGAGELIDGISKGLESSFDVEIELSEKLKSTGLTIGKKVISSANGGTDNWVAVYFIFDQNFKDTITAKVFDPEANEYGRTTAIVNATAGNTFFVDFYFDKRTNIDAKSVLVLE